jgi:hypothetical protein
LTLAEFQFFRIPVATRSGLMSQLFCPAFRVLGGKLFLSGGSALRQCPIRPLDLLQLHYCYMGGSFKSIRACVVAGRGCQFGPTAAFVGAAVAADEKSCRLHR